MYDPPGRADTLSPRLMARWGELIGENHRRLLPEYESDFFALDPDSIPGAARAQVKWFADPAEPAFCIDRGAARRLSDWGVRGRHALHNEYCEYGAVLRPGPDGTPRPKRVVLTTELREYWTMIAEEAPDGVRLLAGEVLGFLPQWRELYGVDNPHALTRRERKHAFARMCAGHGDDPELVAAGVPVQPGGPLNRDHVLFMTHPINGLDDLIQIVLIGARPYHVEAPGGPRPATREQVFRVRPGNERLACRHADPAAAMAAHAAACEGRTVALANPPGIYMLQFNREAFQLGGGPVPEQWVRFSRGEPGMFQRLEFGPPDDCPYFLDDITVAEGALDVPVTGGFQVARHLEVGPLVVVGAPRPLRAEEIVLVSTSDGPIRCHEAAVCESIRALADEYAREHAG